MENTNNGKPLSIAEEIEANVNELLPVTNPDEVLNQYNHLRITDSTEIETPVPIVTINGETICTPGNITGISGPGKAGKSGLTGVILAGAISTSGHIDGFEHLQVEPNRERKAVLHIDTEQARHKHQKNVLGILKRANTSKCPEYFFSYNIRELEISEYEDTTTDLCHATAAKCSGIHLIVIDGIGDYIRGVNDEEQANEIVKYFLDLSSRHNCAVIVVVHTNPGQNSDKERGHLGSQIQRKCESLIMVKSDGNNSVIEPRFLRMAGKGDIPEIRFTWDKEKGYHVSIDAPPKPTADSKAIERLNQIKTVCEQVFSGNGLTYQSAVDGIMKASKKSVSIAKGMFTEMKAHEMIIQGEDKNWRLNV